MLAFVSSYPSVECPVLSLQYCVPKFSCNRWEPIINSPIWCIRILKRPCLLKGLVLFLSMNSKARFTNIWCNSFNKRHKYNTIYWTQYRMLQFLVFKTSRYCTHTSHWLLNKIHCVCVCLRCHGGITQDFVFWDTITCCWVSSPWCFEGTYHEQWTHEYEGDIFLQNNGNFLPSNTASHPSRSESEIHSIIHKHWSCGDKIHILKGMVTASILFTALVTARSQKRMYTYPHNLLQHNTSIQN